jgi:hypothetical protein
MAKNFGMSCPLCLSVNDPVDMLAVTMEHSTPPQSAPLHLCRRCTLEIMKAAMVSDLIDPREVFGDASIRDSTDRAAAPDLDPHSPASALVLPSESDSQDSEIDRLEPKVPAGRKGSARKTEES